MSTQRWSFIAGVALGAVIMGISWKITDFCQNRSAREKACIEARVKVFNQFVGLSRQIPPTYGIGEANLTEALQRALLIGGVGGQDALDALLLEAAGKSLSQEERVALMKWVALGKKETIATVKPTSIYVTRREVFDRARRHRDFSLWLDREWSEYTKLCGGSTHRGATWDARFALDGASPEVFDTWKAWEKSHKDTNEALAEGHRSYVELASHAEAVSRERDAPFPLDHTLRLNPR